LFEKQSAVVLKLVVCAKGAGVGASKIDLQANTFSIGIGLGIAPGNKNRDSIGKKADSDTEAITIRPNIYVTGSTIRSDPSIPSFNET
jgi:hypothetical protein